MPQSGHHTRNAALAGIGAQRRNNVRAHKPGARPCAKSNEVGSALNRLQAVVADLKAQLINHAQQHREAVRCLRLRVFFACAVAKQPKLVCQVYLHAQLLVTDVKLRQGRFFLVPLLGLRHQVVHIHKRLPDALRQRVLVAIGEMGQVALKLHGKKHQLAVQARFCVDGCALCTHGSSPNRYRSGLTNNKRRRSQRGRSRWAGRWPYSGSGNR